jgi:hypothetical protein
VSWKTQEVSPEQALGEGQAEEVRLTLIDGNRIVMEEPRLLGDSLTGMYGDRQITIPLTAVTEVEVREGSHLETVALGLGILLGAGLIAIVTLHAGIAIGCQ